MFKIILENKQPRQTFTKNLSGLSLCFLRIKYCLSVGETCGLPRANTVRPYRVLDNFSAKFARPLRSPFLHDVMFGAFKLRFVGQIEI